MVCVTESMLHGIWCIEYMNTSLLVCTWSLDESLMESPAPYEVFTRSDTRQVS